MGLHQDANNNNNNNPGLHLVLGLSLTSSSCNTTPKEITSPPNKAFSSNFLSSCATHNSDAEPSLTLGLYGERSHTHAAQIPKTVIGQNNVNLCYEVEPVDLSTQTSPHSAVSTFSSGRVVKRERDLSSEEVEATEIERVSSRASDEDEDGATARKKLRLTKEQSALLEESFKQHSTLNPKQKQALARQLNLRPRQVEVWFQNRRARTKLKQTEVDCEFLKKCCETLTDENRRLQKELQELKALKLAEPLYMPMPAATLTMCPSCERLGGVSSSGSTKSPFSLAQKSHFFNPFSNPSAAC